MQRRIDHAQQRLDQASSHLGRPLAQLASQQVRLAGAAHQLHYAIRTRLDQGARLLDHSRLRMELLDPRLVLERGYAWVTDGRGRAVTRAQDLALGQKLRLHLSQGQAGVTVGELSPDEPA